MLFIYYLSDGEIYRASIPEKNMTDFFGKRVEEMSKVFGALYIENYNDFIFNNYYNFTVVGGKLKPKENFKNLFME